MPNGRCRMHGGKSLVGSANGRWKTGRYSKLLPQRMRETYEQSLADDELLTLRDEIALLDTRLADVLRTLETGETELGWVLVQQAFERLTQALRSDDAPRAQAAMRNLEQVIQTGAADYAVWKDVGDMLDRRERLVRSERRRLVELQQTLTMEQAMVFTSAIISLVAANVSDRSALEAITNGIRRLVSIGGEAA